MQEQIMSLILDQDELSWKSLILELVRSEGMNPWNLDLSLLTKRYIQVVKRMKEMDFRVSGKVLLAATILLRVKTDYLIDHDLDELDRLIAQTQEQDDTAYEFEEDFINAIEKIEKQTPPLLIPRTPQPRTRKVSLKELIKALDRALETQKRKVIRKFPSKIPQLPKKNRDIAEIIKNVYLRVKTHYIKNKSTKLSFKDLLPSDSKEDKVFTFVPLLHLDHQRRIDLMQDSSFSDIWIKLLKRS